MDAEGSRHLVADRACRATSYSTVPHEYGEHFREGIYASSHPLQLDGDISIQNALSFVPARILPQVSRLLEKEKADGSAPWRAQSI
jgi:hypothetical protein